MLYGLYFHTAQVRLQPSVQLVPRLVSAPRLKCRALACRRAISSGLSARRLPRATRTVALEGRLVAAVALLFSWSCMPSSSCTKLRCTLLGVDFALDRAGEAASPAPLAALA